jgi:hypothetical protein
MSDRTQRSVCWAAPASLGDLRRVVVPRYRPIAFFVVPDEYRFHLRSRLFTLIQDKYFPAL